MKIKISMGPQDGSEYFEIRDVGDRPELVKDGDPAILSSPVISIRGLGRRAMSRGDHLNLLLGLDDDELEFVRDQSAMTGDPQPTTASDSEALSRFRKLASNIVEVLDDDEIVVGSVHGQFKLEIE